MKLREAALTLLATGSISLAQKSSPTLEVLPLNSTLSNVSIPRYNEKRERVAFLKAGLMEILADGPKIDGRQPIMVDCSEIELQLQGPENQGDVFVKMERARYRLQPGVLTVQEQIVARSERFTLTGNGGTFHLDSQRGFLFGPLEAQIFQTPKPQAMTTPTPLKTAALFASLALPILAQELEHNPPSPAELLEVERLAAPSAPNIAERQNQLDATVTEQSTASQLADERLQTFTEQVDSKNLRLLIQNPPKAIAEADKVPEIENPDYTITCDGGGFFDGEANLLALLRNVVITEKRFTLKANKELKVFFAEKEADAKSLGDVKTLVASGGVYFSGVNEKGDPVEASAATVSYDNSSNRLILTGGRPTFRTQTPRGALRMSSEVADASVIINLTETSFRADTSANGWKIDGAL